MINTEPWKNIAAKQEGQKALLSGMKFRNSKMNPSQSFFIAKCAGFLQGKGNSFLSSFGRCVFEYLFGYISSGRSVFIEKS